MTGAQAAKCALAVCSVLLSIGLVELGLRLVSHPMDLLRPDLEPDPVLGFKVTPGTGGHDAWGFRNGAVPERAEVVTLGDSQTWGIAAVASENWPSWYARQTGRRVYNLGAAGYGPAEYRYLFETRALSLAPEEILVGLYFGNDFFDAWNSVSRAEHWAALRLPSMRGTERPPGWVHPVIVNESRRRDNPAKAIRDWLRVNSMTFRTIEAGPVGQLVNAWGDQRAFFSGAGCSLVEDVPFETVYQPESRFQGMDLETPPIADGVALALDFIGWMAAAAAERGIAFGVVLIPTKESVLLAPRLDALKGDCAHFVREIVAAEARMRERVLGFLRAEGIRHWDTLPALQRTGLSERIYLRSADDHPNGRGYRVIAEQVAGTPAAGTRPGAARGAAASFASVAALGAGS